MIRPPYYSKHLGLRFVLFAGAAMLTLLIGCTTDYGRFSRDADLNQAFKKGEILSELNYYQSGRHAAIGVGPAYKVPSRIWTAFEPQTDRQDKMRGKFGGKHGYAAPGAFMLASDGTVVGIWFYGPHTRSFKVDQEKRIIEPMYVLPSRP
ncbi:MAG: hypothetical protein [Olavius algarvensis Delta 4 endosymbiont]|nr:MAG: hypothetical protein [Olavius algarvensis Delta 4 endosymbiont]